MTERVKRMIGLAPRQTGNKIIINCEKLEKRVALLENGVLEEYTIERPSDRNIVGSIFKGRVKNIEHGLKAMFVDIGYEKNAFLHFWDALPAALDSGIEEVERKITELKGVENWLRMNLGFLEMTIKTLEMQKAALQALSTPPGSGTRS